MSKLFRIVYCSRSCIPDDPEVQEAELEKILAAARRNNPRNDITGALLFTKRCFAQALEGELFDLEATLAKIERDPRHADVRCLERGPIAKRRVFKLVDGFCRQKWTNNPLVGQAMTDAFSGSPPARGELYQPAQRLTRAQSLLPIEVMRSGSAISQFQAFLQASMICS